MVSVGVSGLNQAGYNYLNLQKYGSFVGKERKEAFTGVQCSANGKYQNGCYPDMPEISRFFGIVITMHFRDHNPPHFHAWYGDQSAKFSINELRLLEGELPKRITSFVLEWAFLHRDELLANWEAIEKEGNLKKIEPLE
jgi:hypothetical protein